MKRASRFSVFVLAALFLTAFFVRGGNADSRLPPRAGQAAAPNDAEFSKINAELIRTMTAYRESLEQILGLYEREAERLGGEVARWAPLYEKGYISRMEIEEKEQALNRAKADVERTKTQIEEVRQATVEAEARAEIWRQPAIRARPYLETPALIWYDGRGKWSLADIKKVEGYFLATFGRLLPISAFAQTAVHDKLRLDHRNAVDVAVHPDAPEGRALMAYLRNAGIPFIAFRNRVSGAATGAHIHIGKPSLRLVSK